MVDSLWGEFSFDQEMKTPHSILLEQAKYLTEMSKGLLVGEVKRGSVEQKFLATLRIVAPALNNYSYAVLRISYPIFLYPLIVRDFASSSNFAAEDESQYLTILKQILGSETTLNVIRGLLSQIRADSSASGSPSSDDEQSDDRRENTD